GAPRSRRARARAAARGAAGRRRAPPTSTAPSGCPGWSPSPPPRWPRRSHTCSADPVAPAPGPAQRAAYPVTHTARPASPPSLALAMVATIITFYGDGCHIHHVWRPHERAVGRGDCGGRHERAVGRGDCGGGARTCRRAPALRGGPP